MSKNNQLEDTPKYLRGYFSSVSVCLFVCWLVRQQLYTEAGKQILLIQVADINLMPIKETVITISAPT